MLYRDIIKKLVKQRCLTLAQLAERVGVKDQPSMSMRLRNSWNPRMRDTMEMLDELGYEIAFLPKGTVANQKTHDDWYVPELPDKEDCVKTRK